MKYIFVLLFYYFEPTEKFIDKFQLYFSFYSPYVIEVKFRLFKKKFRYIILFLSHNLDRAL